MKVNRPEREDEDRDEAKGYSLNGKVVIGIGLVMIAAAASTILAMAASQSSQIHLSTKKVFGTSLLEPVPPNTNEHIDKRFVLVQYDFGWNGTIGGPTIKVNKGDVVQITIINAGMMAHNFAIADFSQLD